MSKKDSEKAQMEVVNTDTPEADQSEIATATLLDESTEERISERVDECQEPIEDVEGTSYESELVERFKQAPLMSLDESIRTEVDDVLDNISELEDELERARSAQVLLNNEVKEKSEELKSSRGKNRDLEDEVRRLRARVGEMELAAHETSLLENDLASSRERERRLSETLTELENETKQIRTDLKAADKQLQEMSSVREDCDSAKGELHRVQLKLEETTRRASELNQKKDDLERRIRDIERALSEAREGRQRLQIKQRTSETLYRQLKQVQEMLEENYNSLQVDKKDLEKKHSYTASQNEELARRLQVLEHELASLQYLNRNTDMALESLRRAYNQVCQALNEAKKRACRQDTPGFPN